VQKNNLNSSMKHIIIAITSIIFLCSCRENKVNQEFTYTTKDYLEVARLFRDSIKTFPQVIYLSNRQKSLVFIGTAHTNQVTHQADTIENIFNRFRPQIAFNEGGSVDSSRHYASRNEAIAKNAETGELKFLCDQQRISMVNGDLEDSTEWNELFKIHPRNDVYLYMCNERFLNLYANAWIDTTAGIEQTFQKEFINYYTTRGIKFTEEEKHFSHVKNVYKAFFHEDLNIHTIPAEKFYFLNDGGTLCALGRSSKTIRDKALISKIEKAFQQYDRVMVVFGGAHAVALEPALKQLMRNVKN
jgi:hypothetical protein